MEVDIVAEMEVDMVADINIIINININIDINIDINTNIDININMEIQLGKRDGHRGWLIGPKLFDPKLTQLACLLNFVSLLDSCLRLNGNLCFPPS